MKKRFCDLCGDEIGTLIHNKNWIEHNGFSFILTGFFRGITCGDKETRSEDLHSLDICKNCFLITTEKIAPKKQIIPSNFFVQQIQDEKTPESLLDPERPDIYAIIKAKFNGISDPKEIIITKMEIGEVKDPRDIVYLVIKKISDWLEARTK